jgi:predicted anti-sigma-YlaC factor YlaD
MAENLQCKALLGSLSSYLDGDLEAELCAVLEEHLAGCNNCQVVYNSLLKTIELYHSDGKREEILPEAVRRRLWARLERDRGQGPAA